jgi:hypothetical protein
VWKWCLLVILLSFSLISSEAGHVFASFNIGYLWITSPALHLFIWGYLPLSWLIRLLYTVYIFVIYKYATDISSHSTFIYSLWNLSSMFDGRLSFLSWFCILYSAVCYFILSWLLLSYLTL